LPDWLRLALVRELRKRPDETERVLAAWAALLEPRPEETATALPIEVVRQIEPGLPRLVGSILARRGPYREAILIAFLNRQELPELAIELPQRLAEMLRRRIRWADVAVAAAGLATAVLIATFLGTAATATNAVIDWALTAKQVHFLKNWLPSIGLGLGSLALLCWYLRQIPPAPLDAVLSISSLVSTLENLSPFEMRAGTDNAQAQVQPPKDKLVDWRGANLYWLPIALASGCFIAILGSGLFRDVDPTLVGQVLVAAQLVALCYETDAAASLRWVPLIMLLSLDPIFGGHDYGGGGELLLVVLVAWLALRYPWEELKRMFLYAAPAFLLGLPLGRDISLRGNAGLLIGLIFLARFLSDPAYRAECLAAETLTWRATAVLLLPLGTVVAFQSADWSVSWDPELAFLLVWFLLGLSQVGPAKVLWISLGLVPVLTLASAHPETLSFWNR
jgi:hypothetical protein